MGSSSTRTTTNEEIQRNTTFETVIYPTEGNIQIPLNFCEDWKNELHNKKESRITKDSASEKIWLSLNEDDCFMYYGQKVAATFGIDQPTKVLLDYRSLTNEFAMTYIETMPIPDRPTSFETIISPVNRQIIIPTEFHQLWKREINRLPYGRIVAEQIWARVYFETDGDKFFMHGNLVGEVFDITEAIKVRLEYQIRNNDFKMTYISLAEQEPDDATDIIENDSDAATEVLDGSEDDEDDDDEEQDLDVTVTWYTTVTKALANLSKKQVLHFPNPLSRGILANVNQVNLISEDTDFQVQCKVHTSKRSLKTGKFEKHLGEGWYEYLKIHRPRAGDTLRFVLFRETDDLTARIIR